MHLHPLWNRSLPNLPTLPTGALNVGLGLHLTDYAWATPRLGLKLSPRKGSAGHNLANLTEQNPKAISPTKYCSRDVFCSKPPNKHFLGGKFSPLRQKKMVVQIQQRNLNGQIRSLLQGMDALKDVSNHLLD
jgi:hypothetical protein